MEDVVNVHVHILNSEQVSETEALITIMVRWSLDRGAEVKFSYEKSEDTAQVELLEPKASFVVTVPAGTHVGALPGLLQAMPIIKPGGVIILEAPE